MGRVLGRRGEWLLFGFILIVATALRFYNLEWDSLRLLHPDERMIVMVAERLALPRPSSLSVLFDAAASPLNPHFFAYGAFPIYLLKSVTSLVALAGGRGDYEGLTLVGRFMSAAFDVGSVVLTFLLGRRVFGRATALLGVAFMTFSVVHIQLAHFYAVDTQLVFYVLLTMLCAVNVVDRPGGRWPVLAGAALGLALATKSSVAPLALVLVVALAMRWLSGRAATLLRPDMTQRPLRSRIRRFTLESAVGLVVALAVFLVCEPYALLDWHSLLLAVRQQGKVIRGIQDVPYTLQYLNTPTYWYQVKQLTLVGLGLPLGILAFGGLAYALGRGVVLRRRLELLLLAWVVPFFIISGGFQVKFLRYMLPLVPFLALMAGELLVETWRWSRAGTPSGCRRWRALATRAVRPSIIVVASITLLSSVLWTLAFASIYTRPHTRVAASRWIYDHVPAGATLMRESWDDILPLNLDAEHVSDRYVFEVFDPYAPDSSRKLDLLAENLERADYIIVSSNRAYGSLARLPDRYPLMKRYYELLFAGGLGYDLAEYSASYPRLAGVTLVEDTFSDPRLPMPEPLQQYRPARWMLHLGRIDESFAVYDHPLVMVFRRTRALTTEEMRMALAAGLSLRLP